MSFDGNVRIIASEVALFLKNVDMSLEGNTEGYTSEATSGQMTITSEAPSSVEGSSGCNISEATSRPNVHNFRDAIERGEEQRRENSRGFFWAYAHATVRGDSNPSGQGSQRSCAHQATSASYLGSVEEYGQKVRMSDSGSCEEYDDSISGQV